MKSNFKHIVIIDPATNTAELESFNRLALEQDNFRFSYHLPGLMGMDSLNNLKDSIDGIIIFGSAVSVHDQNEWQQNLNIYVLDKISKSIPILGICYGHQLLAHLEGAKVGYAFSSHIKRKGLYELTMSNSKITKTAKAKFIFSHNEAVLDLGKNWIEVAYSNDLRNEVIEHKTKPLFGIQAHPESSLTFGKKTALVEKLKDSELIDGYKFIDSFLSFLTS